MGEEQKKTRYETIISARNFHYEQFVRWSNYFYVVIGALFVGYYAIMKDNTTSTPETDVLSFVILGIGFLTSMANFLSVKGYIYWWQHWNILLSQFEKDNCDKDEAVYGVFADKCGLNHPTCLFEGSNISTSKVALFIAGVIMLGWSVLIGYRISSCIICVCCDYRTGCLAGLTLLITAFLYMFGAFIAPMLRVFQSDISYHKDLQLLDKNKKELL